MKRILLPIFALLAFSCAPAKLTTFDPTKSVFVSDMTVDKMAHCSVFTQVGKSVYFAYYSDSLQGYENPVIPTITPYLAKADLPLDGNFTRVAAVRSGETYGAFTQDPKRAAYDPNLLRIKDKLYFYFNGCIDGSVTYSVRVYDLKTGTFLNAAMPCTINWNGLKYSLSSHNLMEINEKMGFQTRDANDLTMSSHFVKYKGEWYNVISNAFTDAAKPFVLKTSNGIDFDLVFACSENPGGTCEAALEIKNDELYLLSRNYRNDGGKNGTYLSKYSMKDGKCLVAPIFLSEKTSKTSLLKWKGHIYAFYNIDPDLSKDGIWIERSRLLIARLGDDCSIRDSVEVLSGTGVHYPFTGFIKGRPWMSFTEDRRVIGPLWENSYRYTRSNISIIKLPLK